MIKTTSQLIAQLESGNNIYAMRYEKNWRYITNEIRESFLWAHRGLYFSRDTVDMILSTSWGKHQIMGSVLYEIGFPGKILDFAQNEELQEWYFHEFLETRGIYYSLDELRNDERKRNKFAYRYNGDQTGVYAKRMLNLMGE